MELAARKGMGFEAVLRRARNAVAPTARGQGDRMTLSDAGAAKQAWVFSPVTIIVVVAGAILLVLRPLQNLPFIDDWTYAWSVEYLLETRQLRILDWSTAST